MWNLRENILEQGEKLKKEKVTCTKCKKAVSKYFYDRWHSKICHRIKVIQCEVCGKDGFVSEKTLENHLRAKHSDVRPYKCSYCQMAFPTSEGLSSHRSGKHGVNAKGEVVPKKVFPCAECGKVLTSFSILQRHEEIIHQRKHRFKCSFCDKSFSSEYNAKTHEGSIHTGILPYKCDICKKMFNRKKYLVNHKKTHRNNEVLCDTTSWFFYFKIQLRS